LFERGAIDDAAPRARFAVAARYRRAKILRCDERAMMPRYRRGMLRVTLERGAHMLEAG